MSAAVSAAVRAPWYVRRRAAVALGLRLLMAATLNVLVSQYRGPVRLLTGYVDWAMRRSTAMGALSVGALGVRLPPRRAATLAAVQAVLLLAAQRGACAGVRAAHPNCGTFYRPIAARLSDAAPTNTTSAMPPAAASDVVRRTTRLRRLYWMGIMRPSAARRRP